MAASPSWDVAIDDTSVLLLLAIISLLLFSTLVSRWNQPTLHPLLLGRQATPSQVHRSGESPIYRNVNLPHGFDFASRPRKGVNDVSTLLSLGAKGDEGKHRRQLYGSDLTNEEIVKASRKFGSGLLNIIGGSANDQYALAISVEVDHIESLQAILAGGLLRDASSGKTPFSTLVIPPLHLPQGQPEVFPVHGHKSKLAAVYTTSKVIQKALKMSIATPKTVYILKDLQEVAEAEKALQTNGGSLPRMMSFNQVLDQGSESSSGSEGADACAQAVHSSFWLGSVWTQVTNQSLCAGVTAYLSFYPADKVPTTADRIMIEQSPFVKSPSLHLGAAATPAGLALALTALHTGAALQASPLTSSLDDPNPSTSSKLVSYKPTLIYASPHGVSSLGLALTSKSKQSPLGGTAFRQKLLALRRGTLDRNSMWDSFLFNSIRKSTGTAETRAVSIVGSGWVVGQSLLDILRGHLGCPVVNAFLPDAPLGSYDSTSTAADAPLHSAWLTAPIAASHLYDVQSFQANNKISEMPAHVGPPSVSVELKLVQEEKQGWVSKGQTTDSTPRGWERFKSSGDVIGRVLVRGSILTYQSREGGEEEDGQGWYSTGPSGLFRSNGTLLLLPPSIHAEKRDMAPLPTMSSKFPIKGARKIGAGDDVDEEQREGKEQKE